MNLLTRRSTHVVCRTGWCGSAHRCCWPTREHRRSAEHRRRAARPTSTATPRRSAGPHRHGAAGRRADARCRRLRRHLRPATAHHDVPDVLDRRRHPQPRHARCWHSPRPTGTPACRTARDEAPDFLPVVLEFAATVDPDAGRRLLIEHRVPIDVLRGALADADSPYAHAVTAVCETLPTRHRPGGATRAAARAGRSARGSGGPATVHA